MGLRPVRMRRTRTKPTSGIRIAGPGTRSRVVEAIPQQSATQADATALLEEAVKLDTAFALAWREPAELRPLASGSWSAIRHAMSNRDRLTGSERAFTEATYDQFAGDYQGAITALRNVVNLDPANASAWGNLGDLLLYRAGDDQGGLDAARKALEASGYAPARFRFVVDAELANGDAEAAKRLGFAASAGARRARGNHVPGRLERALRGLRGGGQPVRGLPGGGGASGSGAGARVRVRAASVATRSRLLPHGQLGRMVSAVALREGHAESLERRATEGCAG